MVCFDWIFCESARSLALACGKLGMDFRIAAPEGYQFDESFQEDVHRVIAKTGSTLAMTTSPREAATAADVLYTDTWVSMGQEEEARRRMKAFEGYCIDGDMVDLASEDCIVMHCLPAHRGNEITDDVIEGTHSAVFDQAENRLHAQRALLQTLLQ
jgi:ornithine carbamoyltransferase